MAQSQHDSFFVKSLYEKHGKSLGLTLLSEEETLSRLITVPDVQRPGLSLAGYDKREEDYRILIFGKIECRYLGDLSPSKRSLRLKGVLSEKNPAVIVSRDIEPPKEVVELCQILGIALFRTPMQSRALVNQLTVLLADAFSPIMTCHGTLVDAFGIGVLIQGDSSVGKSEAALGLIERGHRLISDDLVTIRKREESYLEGAGSNLNRHLIEIRGIGIINVAHLYGAVSISESMRIDLVIKLEEWDDDHFYDRVGLEENFIEMLGIKTPFYVLPVKPGRDIVLLLETTVLNHRLKEMGYHSAKEFNMKLLKEIAKRNKDFGKGVKR